MGAEKKDSHIELQDVMRLTPDGNAAVSREKSRKFVDAYVETCEVVEKRELPDEGALQAQAEALPEGAGMMGMMPAMMAGMMPMGMAMPGMMPMAMGRMNP